MSLERMLMSGIVVTWGHNVDFKLGMSDLKQDTRVGLSLILAQLEGIQLDQ